MKDRFYELNKQIDLLQFKWFAFLSLLFVFFSGVFFFILLNAHFVCAVDIYGNFFFFNSLLDRLRLLQRHHSLDRHRLHHRMVATPHSWSLHLLTRK